MEPIRTNGMFLWEGERKLFVRGVSYGPFRMNPRGEPFPDKNVVERDLAMIRALGSNTLRLYEVPPPWLSELVGGFGLRILAGIPWPHHVRFLDGKAVRAGIRRRVREAVLEMSPGPNLLGILIGNEIPPQVVRWYGPEKVARFLSELADEVRGTDPRRLVSYANSPRTEYLELDFLDFVCFNVYLDPERELRAYLPRLQNLARNRPLLLSEFGFGSLREGEAEQARIVSASAAAAAELGCAGAVVSAFSDQALTGSRELASGDFGLVTQDRKRKAAFQALRRVYRSELPRHPASAPRVSVVICAYNAERTMGECLESLRQLRYPNYEVVIIDDGSTDRTAEIAERYGEFRLLRQENRGLSNARNAGILAATGEIVAFTDSDCAVDPDWLTFLVHRLLSSDFGAVGGPNLPPPEDDWVPECVARAPGAPMHVLLSDSEAEHIPGCNMAFWRQPLIEIGLFDPLYRTAGDDVDVCWRLQDRGYRIGFSAAALVWHRRRDSVRAYLRQQRGYGRAEALLSFKHPQRFNLLGHSRWAGRIYDDPGFRALSRRPVIYSGPFGSALFQTLYQPPSRVVQHLPSTLEWNAIALALVLAGVGSRALGFPVPIGVVVLGLLLLMLPLAEAACAARRADVAHLPRWKARGLIAALHYLGPLVRAIERNRHFLARSSRPRDTRCPRMRHRPELDLTRRRFVLSYWSETGVEKEVCIAALVDVLRARGHRVALDSGWQRWDLATRRGLFAQAQIQILVQDHGGCRRQVDVGLQLGQTALARSVALLGILAIPLAAAAGSGSGISLLLASLAVHTGIVLQRGYRLGRMLTHDVAIAFRALALAPLPPAGGRPTDRSPPPGDLAWSARGLRVAATSPPAD